MKTLVYLVSLMLLTGCGSLRNEVNPSVLSAGGAKLVVNSYISPQDTLLTVKVSRSKPVLIEPSEAQPYVVENATVTLSTGGQVVVMRYNGARQLYQARPALMPIRTGQTYTLTVSTPDGKQVTAQATVPQPVPISAISLDSTITTTGTTKNKAYRISFVWEDPATETNFYQYGGYFQWRDSKFTYPIGGQSEVPVPNILVLSFNRDRVTGNVLSDDRQQGGLLTSQSANVASIAVQKGDPKAAEYVTYTYPGARVVAQLLSTEESYYRYTDAVFRQRQVGNSPFAEPVLIPSNIAGGLGCFAAYNRTEKVLLLK
ncbi:DUF4249 domain-containing protein [Fibrella sp. HMF5335]|uniref:DUF4249 domain-containing protein n=1 Tax=Fibrella rubiginis TaxID=2817060 RepID=A0A939GFG4_9BACT|nr:DUF4249 domain-containing protein [Fibrella rubiginis]MBO0935478.1 DUF4249 domain-containing protein [Fibrella rubiginis]